MIIREVRFDNQEEGKETGKKGRKEKKKKRMPVEMMLMTCSTPETRSLK